MLGPASGPPAGRSRREEPTAARLPWAALGSAGVLFPSSSGPPHCTPRSAGAPGGSSGWEAAPRRPPRSIRHRPAWGALSAQPLAAESSVPCSSGNAGLSPERGQAWIQGFAASLTLKKDLGASKALAGVKSFVSHGDFASWSGWTERAGGGRPMGRDWAFPAGQLMAGSGAGRDAPWSVCRSNGGTRCCQGSDPCWGPLEHTRKAGQVFTLLLAVSVVHCEFYPGGQANPEVMSGAICCASGDLVGLVTLAYPHSLWPTANLRLLTAPILVPQAAHWRPPCEECSPSSLHGWLLLRIQLSSPLSPPR